MSPPTHNRLNSLTENNFVIKLIVEILRINPLLSPKDYIISSNVFCLTICPKLTYDCYDGVGVEVKGCYCLLGFCFVVGC
jgi:hypothetical protein